MKEKTKICDSSAMQLESAARQLLLASAERHMLQTEIKQLCEQAPCCVISVRSAWLNCYEKLIIVEHSSGIMYTKN